MDCFVLMARMEFDDLPVRIFANEVCMLHWLQYSKLTFDADIDASGGVARIVTFAVATGRSVGVSQR